MKRIISTLIPVITLVLASFAVTAQTTQSGYVKTKGRMDSKGQLIPGTRLGGAAITLKGGRSTVSANDGNFTLTIPDKKYYLQSVQKQGYQITDPELLKKQYVCSANPLVITMETPSLQLKDQIETQRKIESTLSLLKNK